MKDDPRKCGEARHSSLITLPSYFESPNSDMSAFVCSYSFLR